MTNRSSARAWMVVPALVLFAAVAVLPVGELLALSFSQIRWEQGRALWQFVGVDQYRRVLGDALFRAGLMNTAIFAFCAVVVQMVLGFALALMTTKVLRGRVVYRTVFLLPILVPGIVIGAIWKLMYNFDFGVLNQVLGALGIAPVRLARQPRDRARRRSSPSTSGTGPRSCSCSCSRVSKACRRTCTKRRASTARRLLRSCATSPCR